MKTYYLLIEAGRLIDPATRYFKVAVGQSKYDVSCYRFLTKYALEHGYYFERNSPEVADFLCKIADSINMPLSALQVQKIAISVLVKHIKATGSTPKPSPVTRTAAYQRQIIEPAYYFQTQIKVIQRAEAERRNKPKAHCISKSGFPTLLNVFPSTDGRQNSFNY